MSAQRNLLISQQNQTIYKALKRSMVLWYDVKRQNATNKSMSANPKLLDLSGNGYDADCYNFVWNGISGIGEQLFSSLTSWYKSPKNDGEYTVSNTKLHITKTTNNPSYYINNNKVINNNAFIDSYTENSVTIKPFKVKVSGLPENCNVVMDGIYAVDINSDNYVVPKIKVGNGEHVCDFGTIETAITIGPDYQFQFPRIFTNMPAGTICDVTVELLPGYPDALVFDGVDDYAAVFPFSFVPHSAYYYNNGEYTTGVFTPKGWASMSHGHLNEIPSPFKIRISGISGIEPASTPCKVLLWNESEKVAKPISPVFVEDGVYTVADIDPLPELTPGVLYSMFIDLNSYAGHDVKIDILPDETKALPLFTPEPGFTVIAKRTIISGSTSAAPVAAKATDDDTNGSFKLEYQWNRNGYDSFGGVNNVPHPELITYQTAHKINGSPAVLGNFPDCNFLYLAKNRPISSVTPLNMALYSFILFDRDLTDEEINWVKNNLIEGGGFIP